jgi:hypothetical protein
MQPDTYAAVATQPGLGLGWSRVAQAVGERVERGEIDRIWLFAPVRREEREWGTAVVACRSDSERLRIYTASYLIVIRGRERGRGKVSVEEVGDSPAPVVHEVIAGVLERSGEVEPPVEIAPELWFPELDEQELDEEPPAVTAGAPDTGDEAP